MREENGDQGVGATAFDMPNGKHPGYENKIFHTKNKVPKPNNSSAMNCEPSKVMRQVMESK